MCCKTRLNKLNFTQVYTIKKTSYLQYIIFYKENLMIDKATTKTNFKRFALFVKSIHNNNYTIVFLLIYPN